MTDTLPPPLFRFVAVRRAASAASPLPPPSREILDKAFDFSDKLLPVAAKALAGDDQRTVAKLAAQLLAEMTPAHQAIAVRLRRLLRLVTLNELLALGDVREQFGAAQPAADLDNVVRRAASVVVLEYSLGGALASNTPQALALLRGAVIERLAASRLDAAYRVRDLVKGRSLVLPRIPGKAGAPLSPSLPDLQHLRKDLRRIVSRSGAIGLGDDPLLSDLLAAPIEDLRPEVERAAAAAKRLGLPTSAPTSALARVLDTEIDALSLQNPKDLGTLSVPSFPVRPPSMPVLHAWARVLGRGDLMVVRISHRRYELGEIAYVENVLRSELRSRTNVIDTATSEKIVETSNLFSESSQELTTTDRSELQEAASDSQTATTAISTGMTVSGGFGPVSVGLDLNASQSNSTSQSNSSASTYAREVTDRATETMRSEASTTKTTTNRTRVTETNKHDFDNREGAGHVRGIYRWLNKVDLAQVYNYGERLLLEFIVPEPAAQHVYLATTTATGDEPLAPPPLDFGPADITEQNFVALGRRYDVVGLDRPPPQQIAVPATFSFPPGRPTMQVNPAAETGPQPVNAANTVTTGEVAIPEGYAAGTVVATMVYGGGTAADMGGTVVQEGPAHISVGGRTITINALDVAAAEPVVVELAQRRTGNLPVAIGSQQIQGQAIALRVIAFRTAQGFLAWQHGTFAAIQRAYLAKKAAYESALSVAQLRQGYTAITPSAVNRSLEVRELTRGCQTILTGQDFDLFGSISAPGDDIPRIDVDESLAEADAIQFFSDVFDWQLMAYLFYPYQWAGRSRWPELASRTSADTLHEAFLQAGAARVIVPVREGFEYAVARYLRNGDIPEWGPRPWRGQPTHLPTVDELIADANDRPQGEVAIFEPWEIVSPTTLVYLQEDAELNPDAATEPQVGTG